MPVPICEESGVVDSLTMVALRDAHAVVSLHALRSFAVIIFQVLPCDRPFMVLSL